MAVDQPGAEFHCRPGHFSHAGYPGLRGEVQDEHPGQDPEQLGMETDPGAFNADGNAAVEKDVYPVQQGIKKIKISPQNTQNTQKNKRVPPPGGSVGSI